MSAAERVQLWVFRAVPILWAVYFAIASWAWYRSEFIKLKPRTVTDVYRTAAENFSAGHDLYILQLPDQSEPFLHGFLYPPHSAAAWMPFTWLPYLAGELLWRAIGVALLFAAVRALWRRCVLAEPEASLRWWSAPTHDQLRRSPLWLLMSAVVMVVAGGSTMTGQVNSLVAASFVFGSLALADRRWWSAALWMAFGFAFKPQLLPLIGIAAVLFPRAGWRLIITCAAAAGLAWLKADWS